MPTHIKTKMTLYTGSKFNSAYPKSKFYKLLHTTGSHRGYLYKPGLNIDTNYFDPALPTGLHFVEESHVLCFLFYTGSISKISLVTIPPDARVYKSGHRIKADMIELGDFVDLHDFLSTSLTEPMLREVADSDRNESMDTVIAKVFAWAVYNDFDIGRYIDPSLLTQTALTNTIEFDSDSIKYVPHPMLTNELCMRAVEIDGLNLMYLPSRFKNRALCEVAVKSNSWALEYVTDNLKTIGMCVNAVKSNGLVLEFVPVSIINNSICRYAVESRGYALKYVPKAMRTEEICIEAIKRDPHAIEFVTTEVKKKLNL